MKIFLDFSGFIGKTVRIGSPGIKDEEKTTGKIVGVCVTDTEEKISAESNITLCFIIENKPNDMTSELKSVYVKFKELDKNVVILRK